LNLHLNKICIYSKSIILIKMSSFLSRQATKEQGYFLNILRGSKKGKERASPYPKVSTKTRQMTPEESGSAQQSENPIRRRRLFRDITEEITHLPRPQVIIEEGGNRTEEGGNITEEGGSRTEGESGASQEIVSRKRRREDDDGISN
jgi:hypothetical protein